MSSPDACQVPAINISPAGGKRVRTGLLAPQYGGQLSDSFLEKALLEVYDANYLCLLVG